MESRAGVEWFQFRVISMVFALIDHSSRLIIELKSPCYKGQGIGVLIPHSPFQNLFHRYSEYHFLPQPSIGTQILANPSSRVAVIPVGLSTFSQIPHSVLVKSRIPVTPFQALCYCKNLLSSTRHGRTETGSY